MLLLLLQSAFVWAELPSKTFELPSLTIDVEQPYLIRKQATNLTCTLSAGWSGASLQNVTWLRNGELVDISNPEGDFSSAGRTLTVIGGKTQSEGDYQCLSDVVNITLSNRQTVNTKLVSSPVKLRRARITKFDKISEHMVSVRQGEVARLPCAGMPDVIPGPPEICFEKEGDNTICYGEKDPVNSNFLSTSSGMQIAMVQQAHHGNYFCIVKNEFTKQIRKSPKPVILVVHPADDVALADDLPPAPNLVYPLKHATFEKPVIIDVVQGQDVLLECVFTNAKIFWMKHNDSTPKISLNDADARVRQVWGNLKIKEVTLDDGGIYSCHGVSPLEANPNLEAGDHPKVHYHIVVHGPTSVNLTLSENPIDKSWELSCLATNLKYEIPMAFVNGTALVDAIDQMGVASSTNFFTNPINATMKVKHTFSGSVQCISRPAMDEAEIYGVGLDRGVSQNLYVASTPQATGDLILQGPQNTTVFVGQEVMLPCLAQRVKSKYWMKNDEYVKIYGTKRTRLVGSNTLKIADVQLEDQGWYTCTVTGERNQRNSASAYLTVLTPVTTTAETTTEPFVIPKRDEHLELTNVHGFVTGTSVRLQWSVLGNVSAVAKIANFRIELLRKTNDNGSWMEADRVDSHVRATTIKDLIPNNQYQLRVVLHRDDGTTLISNATDWMTVQLPIGDVPPLAPSIETVSLVSSSVAKVKWTHSALLPNAKARHFHIHYKADRENASHQTKVDGSMNETEISGLAPDDHYIFTITAENHAGKSVPSSQAELNTTVIAMSVFNLLDGITASARTTVILAVAGFCICVLMVVICCAVYCSSRAPKNKKPNGKFLDTSYRIFNEQKVHKSRIPDNGLFVSEDMDECSPLKIKSDDAGSLSSTKFAFNAHGTNNLPNIYGNLDETAEIDEQIHPQESNYSCASKLLAGNGIYGGTPTARCYSPDSGTSHEMIVPYGTGTMRGSLFNPSPLMTSSPQRVSAYKCPDSLLYSPAGTAFSIADTSSSGVVVTRNCDSPSHPPTDGSDQGIRCGGSSRNSQVSSTDGSRPPAMTTFKCNPNTTSFMASTLDRRTLREQISE